MAVPDRSDLPPEFSLRLRKSDASIAEGYGRSPLLPAVETPDELVELAERLEYLITKYYWEGSTGAIALVGLIRLIEKVKARGVTEPVRDFAVSRIDDTDIHDFPDLLKVFNRFTDEIRGTDYSSPEIMGMLRRSAVTYKKKVAADLGLDLELTDDEWWEL